MSDKAVYRTALATPGLLITYLNVNSCVSAILDKIRSQELGTQQICFYSVDSHSKWLKISEIGYLCTKLLIISISFVGLSFELYNVFGQEVSMLIKKKNSQKDVFNKKIAASLFIYILSNLYGKYINPMITSA